MPTIIQKFSDTPFARVLSAFMWRQQPPWTSAKLAHVLGIHRNRPGNWLYHDRVPELNDAISVMAHLGIPMQALLDAYAADGLPVPPLTYSDPRSTLPTPIGSGEAAERAAQAQQGGDEASRAAQRRAEEERREWELMFLHTRRVMAELGMPPATVNAMLGEIQQRRLGKPTDAQVRQAEEMREGERTGDTHDTGNPGNPGHAGGGGASKKNDPTQGKRQRQ